MARGKKAAQTVCVNAPQGLNLRARAGRNEPVLRVLPDGTALTVLGSGGTGPEGWAWLLVETPDGARGYVCADFV